MWWLLAILVVVVALVLLFAYLHARHRRTDDEYRQFLAAQADADPQAATPPTPELEES